MDGIQIGIQEYEKKETELKHLRCRDDQGNTL